LIQERWRIGSTTMRFWGRIESQSKWSARA